MRTSDRQLLEDLFVKVECGECGRKLESVSSECSCWKDRAPGIDLAEQKVRPGAANEG